MSDPLIPPPSADSTEPTKPRKKSGAFYRAERKKREASGGEPSDRVKPSGSKPKPRPRAGTRAAREQTVAGQLMMLSAVLQGLALMSGDDASALSADAATVVKYSDDVAKGLADAAQVSAVVAKLLDGSKDATALGTVAAALAPLMFEIAGNHGLIGGNTDAPAG